VFNPRFDQLGLSQEIRVSTTSFEKTHGHEFETYLRAHSYFLCKLVCNASTTFLLIFSSICMLPESLGRKLSRLAQSTKISGQIKLKEGRTPSGCVVMGAVMCNCPRDREERTIWERMVSTITTPLELLEMRRINFKVLWDETRCSLCATIAIFIAYWQTRGPSSGESALGC